MTIVIQSFWIQGTINERYVDCMRIVTESVTPNSNISLIPHDPENIIKNEQIKILKCITII